MLIVRTIVTPDAAVRAHLVAALSGPGAPVGVVACFERDDVVTVHVDDAITPLDLVDDLITIETHFAPRALAEDELDDEAIARVCAVGLDDPGIDVSRILERRLVGLE